MLNHFTMGLVWKLWAAVMRTAHYELELAPAREQFFVLVSWAGEVSQCGETGQHGAWQATITEWQWSFSSVITENACLGNYLELNRLISPHLQRLKQSVNKTSSIWLTILFIVSCLRFWSHTFPRKLCKLCSGDAELQHSQFVLDCKSIQACEKELVIQ